MTTLRPPPDERTQAELFAFGVVNLDKPAGPTSHQVSTWVREMTGVDRAGHAGTLDPAVTGCLPVLLGDATRLAQALAKGTKQYVALLELHEDPPTDWRETFERFAGEIYQRPPRKSAVTRRLRTRRIERLEILERDKRRVLFSVTCEAGTYIRKLCHDLGTAIGTNGHMAALRRTQSEPFDDRTLITLHDLADALAFYREDGAVDQLREYVVPAERALDHLPRVTITPGAAENVATGAPIYAPGILEVDDSLSPADTDELVACYIPSGTAICLGQLVGDPAQNRGKVIDLVRVLI